MSTKASYVVWEFRVGFFSGIPWWFFYFVTDTTHYILTLCFMSDVRHQSATIRDCFGWRHASVPESSCIYWIYVALYGGSCFIQFQFHCCLHCLWWSGMWSYVTDSVALSLVRYCKQHITLLLLVCSLIAIETCSSVSVSTLKFIDPISKSHLLISTWKADKEKTTDIYLIVRVFWLVLATIFWTTMGDVNHKPVSRL